MIFTSRVKSKNIDPNNKKAITGFVRDGFRFTKH